MGITESWYTNAKLIYACAQGGFSSALWILLWQGYLKISGRELWTSITTLIWYWHLIYAMKNGMDSSHDPSIAQSVTWDLGPLIWSDTGFRSVYMRWHGTLVWLHDKYKDVARCMISFAPRGDALIKETSLWPIDRKWCEQIPPVPISNYYGDTCTSFYHVSSACISSVEIIIVVTLFQSHFCLS